MAGICRCIENLNDFSPVRVIEYDFNSMLLETELVGIELEQTCMAVVVVGCDQRAPFAAMCSFLAILSTFHLFAVLHQKSSLVLLFAVCRS